MMMHGTEDRLGYHAVMPQPVLITGVSSGIGLHAARTLAERGVPVYGTVRSAADAARVAQIDGVEPLICDVADDAQVARLRDEIVARGTGLWGLVNNAGVAHLGDLVDVQIHEMRSLFEVNVFGVLRVTQAVADLIVASAGRIVNVSSIHGTLSTPSGGVYAMSKHALEAFTDSLAVEMRPHDVYVCAVAPGNFDSALVTNFVKNVPLHDKTAEPLRKLYEPGADTSRSNHPPPGPVSEAIFAALFDPEPLRRYLVTPNEREAHATLRKALAEVAQLNRASPHRWSAQELGTLIQEIVDTVDAGGGGVSGAVPADAN